MKPHSKIIGFIAILILSACGEKSPPNPVEVKIPVPVSCRVEPIQEPVWNVSVLSGQETSVNELKAVLADLELSRGYIQELKAAAASCG